MKQLLFSAALLLSIYDLPHDKENVIVEACPEGTNDSEGCTRIKVPRADLESAETLDLLERILNLRRSN